MIKSYTFLICAILAEALGTTTLKLSEQFTKPVPAYCNCFGICNSFLFTQLIFEDYPCWNSLRYLGCGWYCFNSNHRSDSFQTNTRSTRPNRISTNHSWSDNY